MSNLNKGIVFTNDNCIGCNRCISACPVLGANVSCPEDNKNIIKVDGDKCIHCGKCLEVCRHGAREYKDDTKAFISALSSGERISLIVDETFFNNYGEKATNVLGYLQAMGAGEIYNASIGADIATWVYVKFMRDQNKPGLISSVCPVVVNHIVKNKRELLDNLAPVQSPMMCTAIYAKKYLGDDADSFAFISPCVAKSDEVGRSGLVKYSIAIEKLLKSMADRDINDFEAFINDENIGLGIAYPKAGGLSENIIHFEGNSFMIRNVDGTDSAFSYLDEFDNRVKKGKKLPWLVDILNCKSGCICGIGVGTGGENSEEVMLSLHDERNRVTPIYDDGSSPYCSIINTTDRRRRLYERYEKLNLEDFIRIYEKTTEDGSDSSIEYDEDEIFNSMYKYTKKDRMIDCHSCGYDSCKEMVKAIAHGYNYKTNCVHYVKDENERLYLTDTLSGIPNTNAFMEKCSQVIKDDTSSDYFAIYFNIKNMKLINRKYGSKTGDLILIDYAKTVCNLANDDEIVARWGGDNFVGLFKKSRMQEILEGLEEATVSVKKQDTVEKFKIAFRAAIYELTGKEKFPGHIMGQVTTTYATIKQSNQHIIYFTEELGKKILHNTMIDDNLEPALSNNEFVVFYQPKVSMKTKMLVGAEALVRWQKDGKIIPPIEFIPICEANGFVQKIDFYVLEKVCQDMRRWIDKGIEPVKVSFNFSKLHFSEKDVAERINAIAAKYNIPRHYLEVEFTETAYLEEFDNLVETINKLQGFDIESSIDDFGTGYSSLSLLQNVPFKTLKLDKSFLNEYSTNIRNKTVVASIIQMAKKLDMDIVAEGIETVDEFEYLKMLSCDVAQGYLFDKPLPNEEFEKRLINKNYT